MEKEINIDREKITSYYSYRGVWIGLWCCLPLVCMAFALPVLFGLLLILAVIWIAIGCLFLPKWAEALRYSFDDKALRVEKGLIFKSRKTIPFDKITDMELIQGPLLRAFDMWNIKIQTASTGSQIPEATLVGVINPEQVREEILAARDRHFHAPLNTIKSKEFIL